MSDENFIGSTEGDDAQRELRERRIAEAIKRHLGFEKVGFDEDQKHIYVGPVLRDGEEVAELYELAPEVRQFLAGEFPLNDLPAGFMVLLRPTGHTGRVS